MPKLITVVVAFGFALFALPAFAQGESPPPESAAPGADASAEALGEEANADVPEPEALAPATEPSDLSAPASQPADVSAPASQPADVSASASQPADVSAPASQPASGLTGEAPDVDDGGADAGGGTLLAAEVARSDVMERRLVAYVASGVAVVALGTGITLGTLALSKYNCLADVVGCNAGLEQPILGEGFLEQKAEVETLSLLADMAYVVTAAATIVAVSGYIRGYFLTEEDGAAEVTP